MDRARRARAGVRALRAVPVGLRPTPPEDLLVPTLLLAAALAASPSLATPSLAPPRALEQESWDEASWQEEAWEADEPRRPRALFSAWAGEAFASGGSGRSSTFLAAQADWALRSVDLGLAVAGYRALVDASREWTPVALLRITQRFATGRGLEGAFSIGMGAGAPRGWRYWWQVALGMRVPLGPVFLGGEIAFEQYDLLRLGGGLGVAF